MFFVMITASLLWLVFRDPVGILPTMLNASSSGITLAITLAGIYIVWLGIVQVAIDAGIIDKLANLMSPIIRFLFGKQTPEVNALIATNISANMIGAGAAATPAAIRAIELMDKERGGAGSSEKARKDCHNETQERPTTAMIMLFILSATSMQILPTTVIGLLEKHGATASGSIILPTLLVSTITTLIGVILVKVLGKRP